MYNIKKMIYVKSKTKGNIQFINVVTFKSMTLQ